MTRNNYLQKIAIVGASGNVGAATLKNILAENSHIEITIISRADSSATFPSSPRITIKKSSYDDASFLESAFQGNDLALFALSFLGAGQQTALIDAAAAAGVKWILPNEYSGDGTNGKFFAANGAILSSKSAARKQISDLATKYEGLKWIGVVTNPWTELSIIAGGFGIKLQDRTATLYSGLGRFNSSSINQVGLGIARLLSLPVTSSDNSHASLQHYANSFVYLSSFSITQQEVFEAVLRATGTTEKDWTIERASNAETIAKAQAELAGNNFSFQAVGKLLYAHYMGEGLGGDYQQKALGDQKVLGLKEETLDEVAQGAVADPQLFFQPPPQ